MRRSGIGARKTFVLACLALAFAMVFATVARAEDAEAAVSEPASAPPFPLHSVEGVGGSFAVHSAYLVNPAKEGEIFGLPSLGAMHVHFGHGRRLEAFTITETLWDRLELGYGYNYFDAGDLAHDIKRATGMRLSDESVEMHNFNARVQLIKEGSFDQAWMPALTFGVHYKYNDTVNDMDDDLAGTLKAIGIKDNDGVDYTLYASKMITCLPRPVILSAGLRSTEAAHIGLLGFTDDREIVAEGSACVLVTNRFVLAAEYRQKPSEYKTVPGLVEREDDWWTICAAYILNDHATVAGGYGHFGHVLNHKANGSWGVAVKYEF
jgi:hypothetical protein